jgi:predicted nucleic acid-binding protein
MTARESTRLVLDASAVVRIIEGSSQACAFTEAVESAELVLAPELMLTEVANTLWRLQRAGQLQAATLQTLLRRAADLVDHPAYDCLYLVLARREVASLLSADQRLLDLARKVLP